MQSIQIANLEVDGLRTRLRKMSDEDLIARPLPKHGESRRLGMGSGQDRVRLMPPHLKPRNEVKIESNIHEMRTLDRGLYDHF